MCSDLIKIEDQLFACRKCNECLTSRKNGWVARAMAEKSLTPETFSITLTYNEKTEENRDAAKTFDYSTVSRFFKRLRSQIKENLGIVGQVRYIVAGEIGSEKGRCHWHVIVFASCDILQLGTMKTWPKGDVITEREDKITHGTKDVKRINWSLWKHGFITFQEPDQWGMEYALAYALKDQFNIKKSEGTMRETKAEITASGMFRPSKLPPIGEQFLQNKIAEAKETGQLPVTLQIKVPGYTGYWYPTREQRERWLDGLREANAIRKEKTGNDAPQWRALLASCSENEKDYERLTNGPEKSEEEESERDAFEAQIRIRGKEETARKEDAETRFRCGRIEPCEQCARGLSEDEFRKATRYAARQVRRYGNFDKANENARQKRVCNPFCGRRELPSNKRVFK